MAADHDEHRHDSRGHIGHVHGSGPHRTLAEDHDSHGAHEHDTGLAPEHDRAREHARHSEHASHDRTDHDKHAGHSVEMFRNKFWGTLLLSIPTLVWAPMAQHWFRYEPWGGPAASRWLPSNWRTGRCESSNHR